MKRQKEPQIQETINRMYQDQASELFWLAFLLTGDRSRSVEAAINALRMEEDAPFFENWMIAWSRKLVIAQALGGIHTEMQESVARTAGRAAEYPAALNRLSLSGWSLAPGTNRIQLERALLSIDLFPRCAVLLMVFEHLSAEDTAIILDVSKELVENARMIGLAELARTLASTEDPAWEPRRQMISLDQMQHVTI